MGGRFAADTGDVCGVVYGDGLGMLVLGMVLLGVDLFVLFEVLGTLEGLLANLRGVSGARWRADDKYLADMGLEGGVHWRGGQEGRGSGGRCTSEMGGDVVALGAGGAAVLPLAGEAEVVGGLAADVVVAEVVVEELWVGEGGVAAEPFTEVIVCHRGRWSTWSTPNSNTRERCQAIIRRQDNAKRFRQDRRRSLSLPSPPPSAHAGCPPSPPATMRARREASGLFSLFQPPQVQQFKEAFQLIDHDKDGWVTENDLRQIFSSLGKPLLPDAPRLTPRQASPRPSPCSMTSSPHVPAPPRPSPPTPASTLPCSSP